MSGDTRLVFRKTKGSIPKQLLRNIPFIHCSTQNYCFYLRVFTISVRSFTYIFVKCSVEDWRLAKPTTSCWFLLHSCRHISYPSINVLHLLLCTHSTGMNGWKHTKTRIYYSRQIASVGFQLFCQIFSWVIGIFVLLLHNYDIQYLVIQLICQFRTNQRAVSSILLFFSLRL